MRTCFQLDIDGLDVCGVRVKPGDKISFHLGGLEQDLSFINYNVVDVIHLEICGGHDESNIVTDHAEYLKVSPPVQVAGDYVTTKVPVEWFTDIEVTP